MQAGLVTLVPEDAVAFLDCEWRGGGLSLQSPQAQSLQTALACGFLGLCLSVCAGSTAPGQAAPIPACVLLCITACFPLVIAHPCLLPAPPCLLFACCSAACPCLLPTRWYLPSPRPVLACSLSIGTCYLPVAACSLPVL